MGRNGTRTTRTSCLTLGSLGWEHRFSVARQVAEGTDPEPLTTLEELEAKAKVQIWDYNPRISAYSAADEEAGQATSEATEEAADATEAAAAAEQEKQQAVANEEKLAAARQAADVMMRYEKEAAEAVSLSDTGEMQVSVVSGHILDHLALVMIRH